MNQNKLISLLKAQKITRIIDIAGQGYRICYNKQGHILPYRMNAKGNKYGTAPVFENAQDFSDRFMEKDMRVLCYGECKDEGEIYQMPKVNILTVSLPAENPQNAFVSLKELVNTAGGLICKAFNADSLHIDRDSGVTVDFILKGENIDPYSHEVVNAAQVLFSAMWKRAKDRPVRVRSFKNESEKYDFRLWLFSLGLRAKEYKDVRKILMSNLSGDIAFANAEMKKRWYDVHANHN